MAEKQTPEALITETLSWRSTDTTAPDAFGPAFLTATGKWHPTGSRPQKEWTRETRRAHYYFKRLCTAVAQRY